MYEKETMRIPSWDPIMGSDHAMDDADEKMNQLVCGTAEVMSKMICNNVIYAILANDDPYEYPLAQDGPLAKPISKYSSIVSGYCTFDYTVKMCSQYGSGPERCTESKESMTQAKCDCSDPENYNFADKGRIKI